jgi:hypothetical protein
VNAQPGEHDGRPGDGERAATPLRGSAGAAESLAASTWVPPESLDPGAHPAWMPPGAQHGQQYPTPYGQPPPHPQPPPYVRQGPPARPRMPRWAKIVLVIGIVTYVLGGILELVNIYVLSGNR